MNEPEIPTLEVRLQAPDRVKAGAVVPAQLTLVSRGDQPLSLVTPLYNAALNLVVFDALWNMLVPQAIGKVHVASAQIALAPEERITVGLDDLSYVSGTGQMTFTLKPGVYFILAVYHPGTARLPKDSEYPTIVVSNVIRLIVD